MTLEERVELATQRVDEVLQALENPHTTFLLNDRALYLAVGRTLDALRYAVLEIRDIQTGLSEFRAELEGE